MSCRFKDEYYGFECDSPETDILKSGLCIFHDKKYLKGRKIKKSNEQNIQRKLTEKIEKSIADNKPLVCIEYSLPDFSFENFLSFTNPVYFKGTIFMGSVDFSKAQFTGEVDFSDAQFTKEANFREAEFTEKADFQGAQFTKAYFSKAQFTKEANFREAEFTEKADFQGAQFIEEAYFSKAQFTKKAISGTQQFTDFREAKFIEAYFNSAEFIDVYFSKAQFGRRGIFSDAQFKVANFVNAQFTIASFSDAHITEAYFNDVQFTEAEFAGAQIMEAQFRETQFIEEAFFWKVQFAKADFQGAQFTEKADFTEAQFTNAYFREAEFTEKADFTEAQFTNAYFSKAQFTKEANFREAEFTEKADFTEAQFIEEAYFSARFANEANFFKAQFSERANFSGAQFSEIANFSGAQFANEANFFKAQFSEQANFSGAQFANEANFFKAQFSERANFSGAQFANEAYFSLAQFYERTDFSESYFRRASFTAANFNEVVFYKTQFAEKADFSEIKSTIEKAYPRLVFHNAQFDIPEHIIFLKDNLSETSFVHTDITRVRFEDVVWGDKFKILEEKEIENQLKTKNLATYIRLEDVLAVYRNLRENYEYRLRYDEAGEFFIRELEMKRRYEVISSHSWKNIFRLRWRIDEIRLQEETNISELARNNWLSRNFSLTGVFYHLSRYGQSISRPVLFGIGIVLFSTLLWLTQPNPAADFSFQNITLPQIVTIPEMDNKTNIQIAFERGLINFLPSLSFGTELNVGLLDVAFKIVGGAVTFGLIIIALRRKFERKFRH